MRLLTSRILDIVKAAWLLKPYGDIVLKDNLLWKVCRLRCCQPRGGCSVAEAAAQQKGMDEDASFDFSFTYVCTQQTSAAQSILAIGKNYMLRSGNHVIWVRRASRKHLRVVPTKLPARGKTRMENIKHYAAKRQGTACTAFSTNALHHPQTKEQPPPASPARRNKLSFKYKLLPVCTRYFHPSGKHQNTGTTTNTISTKERTPVGAEAHGTKHAMKSCN